ncbi:MAG: phage gp6-like head-tail connector protein [Rhodoferax sp.]|nr:phage gp6-like head-tail connector protein [Rhodoferax sp.]
MSVITLFQIKSDLRVLHNEDDSLLQILLDASEDEAMRFMNRTQLPTLPVDYPPVYDSNLVEQPEDVPSSGDPLAPSVYAGVFLLVRSKYDSVDPAEISKLRACAETVLMPYRTVMGV